MLINLAKMAIVVAAEKKVMQEVDVEPIPKGGSETVYMEGTWTQIDSWYISDEGDEKQALIMDFTVGGKAWPDDTILMMWVSF